jgi:hypothetical protein
MRRLQSENLAATDGSREVSRMKFRNVGRVDLLVAMVALAAPSVLSQRVALAQIPEAPGTYIEPDGVVEDAVEPGQPRKGKKPQSQTPAPDTKALDTIEEMDRARARAEGTPEAEPTPRNAW